MEDTIETASEFASVVNTALELRGWTRDELAKAIKKSPSSVSGWLNAQRTPPLEIAFAMEEALQLDQGRLAKYLNRYPIVVVTPSEESWEGLFIEALARNHHLTKSDREMFITIMRNVMAMRQALSETESDS